MGSVQQFAAFFCICSLIRVVATHTNQDEVKHFNYNRSNPNSPDEGDFYFAKEKRNDDTVKSGRAISQSAWSKEDKEPSRPDESKTDTQISDESSIKKFLSYLLNAVHELKKDIFGIKEMALKETKELPNHHDSSEGKDQQIKLGKKQDLSKLVDSTENTELRNRNQRPSSNYLTDYYRDNGIKITDDEDDDDLKDFSDVSDDSSHKPNEARTLKDSKSIENKNSLKSIKIKRNPDSYSFETKKTSSILTSETKIPEEKVQEFDEIKKSSKCGDCKESAAKTEYNYSKEVSKGPEGGKASRSNFKSRKCVKKNSKSSDNYLNKKNKSTEKPLKSDDFGTVESHQNGDSPQEELQRSDQDKTPKNNSKNKNISDFDRNLDFLEQSTTTTVPSQTPKDFNIPKHDNKPKASGAPLEKHYEQITSSKPKSKKESQNNANVWTDNDGISEHTTVSFQSQEPVLENPNHQMTTEAYTFDSEINDTAKESKEEGSTVILSQTIVTYNENEPNSEINRLQTSNSFDISKNIVPTTSGSRMNKSSSDNLSDKTSTTKNDESEQSNTGKNSETQIDDETEQAKVEQVNDDSQPENTLENKKLIDSNAGNDDEDKDDHVDSTTTNDLSSQNSNHEIQNHVKIESDKLQETQENEESKVQDSADQEDGDDAVEFDIWDKSDSQDSDQNQKNEQNANNEDNDGINPGNTETILTNESQISQHTGQTIEEKSEEQFDTFLEYFYKHSNNSFFQSLKNQSQSSSEGEDAH